MKTTLRKPRLSPTQRAWLVALLTGHNPEAALVGRSAHGGAAGTTFSLRKRGLLDLRGRLTIAGRVAAREAIREEEERERKAGGR